MISRHVWAPAIRKINGGADLFSALWETRRISKIPEYYNRKNYLMEICQFYSKKSKYIYGQNHYSDLYNLEKENLIVDYERRVKYYQYGDELEYLKTECTLLAKQMIVGYALCTIPYFTQEDATSISDAYLNVTKFIKGEVSTKLSANLVTKILDEVTKSRSSRKNIIR